MFPCEDSKTVSVCTSVCQSVRTPRKDITIASQYQSYISNWCINGKVFTSTTPWKPKNLIFFQKSSKFEFWLLTKSWNHLSFVNISPTLVIDSSMERSSWVLHHGNPKIWFFFSKKFEIRISTFDEELKSPYLRSSISVLQLVIDTSMEWSSRVLRHGNPKIWFFFQIVRNSNLDFWRRAEIILASSISVLH